MKKAQSNDAEAIVFVKAILPENLHQFAHLIPQAVNNHVSWLDPERKKYALTVGLAAFDKAVKKRREGATDGEFGEYAKQCLRGALLNEFANEIADRQYILTTPTRRMDFVAYDEDSEDVRRVFVEDYFRPSDYDYTDVDEDIDYDDGEDDWYEWEDDGERWQSRFASVSGEIPADYLEPGDSLYRPWFDGSDEYTSLALSLLGPVEEGDVLDLLPERERDLLRRYEHGETVTAIAHAEQLCKARISQLLKQATDRCDKYKARLILGERFSDLLTESHKANETAAKKQLSSAKSASSASSNPIP